MRPGPGGRPGVLAVPYGDGLATAAVDPARAVHVLESRPGPGSAGRDGPALLREAMADPVGSPRLGELARGKRDVVILTSDHTRPVPSHLTVPLLISEIRGASPGAEITVVIGVGCHRGSTPEEIRAKFGEAACRSERIVNHDPRDEGNLVSLGPLPSGGELRINRKACEADLLVADGFIEPHQFAGFSGGPKSVLPGIAAFETVLASHNAEFTVHPRARPGSLDGNPFREDMVFAARKARLAFILNVTLDPDKRISAAFAGDPVEAHARGCDFVLSQSAVRGVTSPVVVTSNGGYPLDQNIYQSTKSIMQADLVCGDGGVIVAVNECRDGHGSESFLDSFRAAPSLEALLSEIRGRDRHHTVPDQWVTQLTASILARRRVIMVTRARAADVEALGMVKAGDLGAALRLADGMTGDPLAPISVLPHAVAVVIRP
ncbi:MAG: nickel-dependent lactate racemase [Deltaproteobacteria bacterium]|jgi:nickel-dependent lactate racemase|nr:nickel-dependent lactate racemase [Deltaproteobacteria bacterium]